MKRKIYVLSVAVFLLFAALFSACVNKTEENKIESINGKGTVYRYVIKQLELINTGSEQQEVLEINEQFKYYYTDTEMTGVYATKFYSYPSEPYSINDISCYHQITKYFENIGAESVVIDYQSRCFSSKYDTFVAMRVVVDKCDKEYRPSYKTSDGLITVSYYKIENGIRIAKKEVPYSTYKSDCFDYNKKLFECGNDENKVSALKDEFKAEYDSAAVLLKESFSENANNYSVSVKYNK